MLSGGAGAARIGSASNVRDPCPELAAYVCKACDELWRYTSGGDGDLGILAEPCLEPCLESL